MDNTTKLRLQKRLFAISIPSLIRAQTATRFHSAEYVFYATYHTKRHLLKYLTDCMIYMA